MVVNVSDRFEQLAGPDCRRVDALGERMYAEFCEETPTAKSLAANLPFPILAASRRSLTVDVAACADLCPRLLLPTGKVPLVIAGIDQLTARKQLVYHIRNLQDHLAKYGEPDGDHIAECTDRKLRSHDGPRRMLVYVLDKGECVATSQCRPLTPHRILCPDRLPGLVVKDDVWEEVLAYLVDWASIDAYVF
jgi:hypothetical protein